MAESRKVALSALPFLPARISLSSLHEASRGCRGCPLFQNATQTVFGEGIATARIILVGEQPGDEEDRSGRPFVGPAGRVLDEALDAAGIRRGATYVTNVVKHFKWVPKGRRRMHQKPSAREIAACLPWLEKEIEAVRPTIVVCLGATAAQALLGRGFRVTLQRGRVVTASFAGHALATVHPSSILRQPTPEDRRREMDRMVADLAIAAEFIRESRAPAATRSDPPPSRHRTRA